jgi:hypothetical protein
VARTLAELIARARSFADQENSDFVTAAEAAEMVNAGWGELYSLLVSTFEDYFITTAEIELVAGTEEYALPDGTDEDPIVFKLRGVDLEDGGNEFSPLKRFQWSERVKYAAPNTAGTVRLTYVPICPKLITPPEDPDDILVSQITTLPIQVKPSWDEFIAVEVALQMLAKEQNESSYLLQKKERITKEILSMAPVRDADEAPRMVLRTTHLDGDDDDFCEEGYGRFRSSPDGHALRFALKDERIVFRSSGEW